MYVFEYDVHLWTYDDFMWGDKSINGRNVDKWTREKKDNKSS